MTITLRHMPQVRSWNSKQGEYWSIVGFFCFAGVYHFQCTTQVVTKISNNKKKASTLVASCCFFVPFFFFVFLKSPVASQKLLNIATKSPKVFSLILTTMLPNPYHSSPRLAVPSVSLSTAHFGEIFQNLKGQGYAFTLGWFTISRPGYLQLHHYYISPACSTLSFAVWLLHYTFPNNNFNA